MSAGTAAGAIGPASAPPTFSSPVPSTPVIPRAVDLDLRTLPLVDGWRPGQLIRTHPRRRSPPPTVFRSQPPDPVVQRTTGRSRIGAPSRSFDGIHATGSVPPDPVGDVGPDHYVQMVNTVFSIYDKTGTLLAGPSSINSLWAVDPPDPMGPCATQNRGDPIVLYDHLADRWLLSQFAGSTPSAFECVAISKGPNPVTDGFYLYDFPVGAFPDYPKFGLWPDAYYMGSNLGGSAGAYAFDRASMLAGDPATLVAFTVGSLGLHSMIMPSDLDGPAPPAGAPNTFYRFVDGETAGGSDRIELFEFHVDFATPVNSTFTGPTGVATAPFVSLCNFDFDCIDQPDTTQRVDSITEWPMWRFQYRNFGAHQTLVGNHAVDVSGAGMGGNDAGVRWFELRKSGAGGWSMHQQSTYAPDDESRWMGSIAMDSGGNLALAYSVSSDTVSPSLRYTGRLAADALDQMTVAEATLVAGAGSQLGSNRWGDYSALSADPADGCSFWFTGEYYLLSSGGGWRTRIGRFELDCAGNPCPELSTLSNLDVDTPKLEKAQQTLTLGPELAILSTGGLTTRAGVSVILTNGTRVMSDGELTVQVVPNPCA